MDGIAISITTLILTSVVSLFVATIISFLSKALLFFSKKNKHIRKAENTTNTSMEDIEVAIAILATSISRKALS